MGGAEKGPGIGWSRSLHKAKVTNQDGGDIVCDKRA